MPGAPVNRGPDLGGVGLLGNGDLSVSVLLVGPGVQGETGGLAVSDRDVVSLKAGSKSHESFKSLTVVPEQC